MAVSRGASAVPRKAAAARRTTADRKTAASSTPTVDLISVRMTALNYARSLFGNGDVGGTSAGVTSASKVVTQAKRFERYILGTDSEEDV